MTMTWHADAHTWGQCTAGCAAGRGAQRRAKRPWPVRQGRLHARADRHRAGQRVAVMHSAWHEVLASAMARGLQCTRARPGLAAPRSSARHGCDREMLQHQDASFVYELVGIAV